MRAAWLVALFTKGKKGATARNDTRDIGENKVQRLLHFLIATTVLVSTLVGCADEMAPDEEAVVTAFVNVHLVPMTGEVIVESQTVLVEGTRITAIGLSNEVTIPKNAVVIDGAGAYLMPGLADMHAHVFRNWQGDDWPVSPLNLYLANGVTTIRSLGSGEASVDFVLDMRDEINQGKRSGPTIYATGPTLDGPLGELPTVSGRGEAERIVREQKDQGYDCIKLYSHLPTELFHEVVTTAAELEMYTVGHIPYAVGLNGVLSAGMDEIAHIEQLNWELVDFDRNKNLNWQEWGDYLVENVILQLESFDFDFNAFLEQKRATISQIVKTLQSANVTICTTAVVAEVMVQKKEPETFLARPQLAYKPDRFLDRVRRGEDRHQKFPEDLVNFKYALDMMLLRELKQAGIPLVLGTDAGTGELGIVPGFSVHDELRLMTENGFTPYEAITTGTVNAARVVAEMTGEGDFGTIELGKRADLILVRGNPLEDVANIKDPLGVMAAGSWYSKEALMQMIAVEE
jgi:imidazolonepropionase-like amidohydrolase